MFAYRRELNEAEQENTSGAQNSALATRRELLTAKIVKDLHSRMLLRVGRRVHRRLRSETSR
jgi:hypothetical protein